MPKKPDAAKILAARPLSAHDLADRFAACNVCRLPSPPTALRAWRECDERDMPIEGPTALVFIAIDHPACLKAMERHPRLYHEAEPGEPGHFPQLCGPCMWRTRELGCRHPDAKANGGAGLQVTLGGLGANRNIIACSRRGRVRLPVHAEACAGFDIGVCLVCKRAPAECDCTGGAQLEAECTCYEFIGGHQPGCPMYRP